MDYHLVTRFGAILLDRTVNSIGRERCAVKLYSKHCSRRHAVIMYLSDGSIKIKNQSMYNYIFVNDQKVVPNQSCILAEGDLISFSGVETFKLYRGDICVDLTLSSPISLSPD